MVYSFSKYFGATGWRLGVIATHEKNILDKQIAALPAKLNQEVNDRYDSITTDPKHLKFIDRLVADSWAVALNHTAGLATPAQAQMVLFSLFAMMDEVGAYKAAAKRLVRRRKHALYRNTGVKVTCEPNEVDYYQLLDLETLGKEMYGQEFVDWVLKTMRPNEFLFRLAAEANTVLLPGQGFGTCHPSARVSLANLKEVDYTRIGQGLLKLAEELYDEFQAGKRNAPDHSKS